MKRLTNVLVALSTMLCFVSTAQAEPAWGVNCLSCHGEQLTDTLYLFGEDTIADPDESATGAPDRGPLPVFRAAPGQTKTLQVEVAGLDAGDTYAVELKRLRFPGVVSGQELTYTDNCNWPYWGEPGKYYTDPAIGYSWGSGPTTFAFDIGVDLDAPEDYYDLVFAVVGRLAGGSELFYSEEHFYLFVTLPGDADGDGDVDWDDFAVFAACFTGCDGRLDAGCECADLDGDGDVDCMDWNLFRRSWTGPDDPPEFALCAYEIPAVSEWSVVVMTLLLVTTGALVLRQRRIQAWCSHQPRS